MQALRADMAGLTLLYPDGRARTAVWTSPGGDRGRPSAVRRRRRPVPPGVPHAGPAAGARHLDRRTLARVRGRGRPARRAELAVDRRSSSPARAIGALNLYSVEVHHFTEDDEEHGALYAGRGRRDPGQRPGVLGASQPRREPMHAMESRAVIEQAKGVIMATAGVDPDEAFDLLRQQSQPRTASCATSPPRSSPARSAPTRRPTSCSDPVGRGAGTPRVGVTAPSSALGGSCSSGRSDSWSDAWRSRDPSRPSRCTRSPPSPIVVMAACSDDDPGVERIDADDHRRDDDHDDRRTRGTARSYRVPATGPRQGTGPGRPVHGER